MKSKNRKPAFTLVELLVCLSIVAVVIALVLSAIKGYSSDDEFDFTYLNPRLETARQTRRLADEAARRNDLLEEQLRQLKNDANSKKTLQAEDE